jgi:hypothetical protein
MIDQPFNREADRQQYMSFYGARSLATAAPFPLVCDFYYTRLASAELEGNVRSTILENWARGAAASLGSDAAG